VGEVSGYVYACSPCFTCGRLFTYNPHLVPSVPIDPETRHPLDVDEHGNTQPIDPAAAARAVKQPLCSTCITLVNERRVARGDEPIYIFPDAYEAIEAGQL
jgi:hypothetical protein